MNSISCYKSSCYFSDISYNQRITVYSKWIKYNMYQTIKYINIIIPSRVKFNARLNSEELFFFPMIVKFANNHFIYNHFIWLYLISYSHYKVSPNFHQISSIDIMPNMNENFPF